MTRSPESIGRLAVQVKVIKADVSNYADLRKALAGIDVTFYLIHSMGSSKDWKKFVERDRNAAENFAKCASECRVKRIFYLGGLYYEKNIERLSDHMRSRNQVGEILKTSARVTIFRLRLFWDKVEDHFKCYNIWLRGFLLWYVQNGF